MSDPSMPRDAGRLRWPAEWERHDATWLAYPHNRETWPGKFEPIPASYEAWIRVIAEREPVNLLASPDNIERTTLQRLANIPNVQLIDIPTNDAWIRDYGPTFLTPDAAIVWRYNAWGEKYPPYDKDAAAAERIIEVARVDSFASRLTLEGGAIEGNGIGDLLSTEGCVLHTARNPGMSRADVEAELTRLLDCQNIIWLPEATLAGDDTDGHIDQLARFVSPTTLVVATSSIADDQASLKANQGFLESLESCSGDRFEVHALPLPPPTYFGEHRLPASYCNFYFCNDTIIAPTFRQPKSDDYACGLLRELCPQRDVVALDALDLVWGLGAFHCLSQPQFSTIATSQR